MQILALDASTEWCSVALGGEGGFDERAQEAGQRHSELILPMVQSLLERAGTSLAQLDGIAFGAGPVADGASASKASIVRLSSTGSPG